MSQRRPRLGQLRRAHAQHHQRLLGTNLIRVIGHPHPVVRRLDGLFQSGHTHALHPVPNRRPIGNLWLQTQPLENDPQHRLSTTQTHLLSHVHTQRNHPRPIPMRAQWRILRQPRRRLLENTPVRFVLTALNTEFGEPCCVRRPFSFGLRSQIADLLVKVFHSPLQPPNLLGHSLTTAPQPSRQSRPPGLDRPTKTLP